MYFSFVVVISFFVLFLCNVEIHKQVIVAVVVVIVVVVVVLLRNHFAVACFFIDTFFFWWVLICICDGHSRFSKGNLRWKWNKHVQVSPPHLYICMFVRGGAFSKREPLKTNRLVVFQFCFCYLFFCFVLVTSWNS